MPYKLKIGDYSKESSIFEVNTGPVNALTFDEVQGQAADMKAKVATVIMGTELTEVLTAFDNILSMIYPTNKEAQREKKWLISYIDNTPFLDPPVNSIANPGFQKGFSASLPTADLSHLTTPGSDIVDLSVSPWPNFVTSFQALARSPYGGQPLVTRIMFVGRNS